MKIKNSTKVFALLTLAIFSLISIASFGSAVLPVNDGFEYSSSLQSNGWILSGSGAGEEWTVKSDSFFHSGTKYAQTMPDGILAMQKKYSTVGYESIKVTFFKWTGESGGSFENDQLTVTWSSDGNTFNNAGVISQTDDSGYVELSFDVSSAGWNNPNFAIKFECDADAQAEFCRIDDIKIEGNPIALSITPETQPIRSGLNATITVANTGQTNFNNILMTSDTTIFGTITFLPPNFQLPGTSSQIVTVILDKLTNLEFGNNAITIKADAGNGITDTATINVQKGFCEFGPKGGNLSIDSFDISVIDGEGDENNWQLLDTIEVEFDVRNNHNDDDINDVFVELALLDSNGNDQAGDLTFESDDEKIDIGNLDSDSEETVVYTFKVPADLNTENYLLAIKAYSDDLGEDEECTDVFDNKLFEEISVDTVDNDEEGKFIAFDDITLTPSDATCGDVVSLTTDVFNVGDNEEDRVRVNLVNTELGINQFYEIKSKMDTGDRRTASFDFTLPKGLENKVYQLRLSADYEFDNGDYDQSSDEDTLVPLNVLGCADDGSNENDQFVVINAALDSEAKAGQPLIVKSTITNTGSSTATFIVGARGYESWASLSQISQRIVTIPAGQTAEVLFTFDVKEDVEGEKSFFIQVNNEAGDVKEAEVQASITGAGSGGFSFGEGNSLIWVIGIVNVILIILIIIVAIRVSRR